VITPVAGAWRLPRSFLSSAGHWCLRASRLAQVLEYRRIFIISLASAARLLHIINVDGWKKFLVITTFSVLAVLYETGLLLEWHRTKVNLEIHFVALRLRAG